VRRIHVILAAGGLLALAGGCSRQAAPDPRLAPPPPQQGIASWYGAAHHGKLTANGERFDKEAFTAAHPRLRFGTCVRVRHLGNGREVQVRINDRGPYAGGRIIDLSEAAARQLQMVEKGVARVELLPCR
jgi:rare lipoprotein A